MTITSQPTVTVHHDSRHPETASTDTRTALDTAGIPYQLVDLATDPEVATQLWHEGYRDLPVVTVGAATWTGHQPARIAQLARVHARSGGTHEPAPVDPMDALQCDSCQ